MPNCNTCGEPIAVTEMLDGGLPRAGDVAICTECGGLMVFTGHDRDLRAATDRELAELLFDSDVRQARAAIALAKEERRG